MPLTLNLEHVYGNDYLLHIIVCDERSSQSFTIKCVYDSSNIMILDNDHHSTEWCGEEWDNMLYHDGTFTFLSDDCTGTGIQCRYNLGVFTLEVTTGCVGVKSTQTISCDVKREILENFEEHVDRQIYRHRLQEELDYIRYKLYGVNVLDGHCDLTDQDIETIRYFVGQRDTLGAIRDHCHSPEKVDQGREAITTPVDEIFRDTLGTIRNHYEVFNRVKGVEDLGRETITTPMDGSLQLPYWGMRSTSNYHQNKGEWRPKSENQSVSSELKNSDGYSAVTSSENHTLYEMQTDEGF